MRLWVCVERFGCDLGGLADDGGTATNFGGTSRVSARLTRGLPNCTATSSSWS